MEPQKSVVPTVPSFGVVVAGDSGNGTLLVGVLPARPSGKLRSPNGDNPRGTNGVSLWSVYAVRARGCCLVAANYLRPPRCLIRSNQYEDYKHQPDPSQQFTEAGGVSVF